VANRYSAFILGELATVRPADIGISDVEWHHGVRCLLSDTTSFHSTTETLEEAGFITLTADEWVAELNSRNDPETLQVDHYKSTRITPDKWDTRPEIY
jgi:hypothetical protein